MSVSLVDDDLMSDGGSDYSGGVEIERRRTEVLANHLLNDKELDFLGKQMAVPTDHDDFLQRARRLEAIRVVLESHNTQRNPAKQKEQEEVYDTLECCPDIYQDGILCSCCCGGFGHKKCFGHKVGKCEPKWVLKLLMVFTELAWAISLTNNMDTFKNPEFIQTYVLPMAWCAWNAMTLHVIMQFMNRVCFGKDALLDQMALYIDLFADDLVQLIGLSMFWSKEGFGTGDAPAAILTGCLAIVFALHNVFALCAGGGGAGKKLCWGRGHTLPGYKAIDYVDIAWCPHCTCPTLAKCCAWMCSDFCNCCPTGYEERWEMCCFKSCYTPVWNDDKGLEAECNIVCYQCNIFSDGKHAASCGQIFCHIMSNTWLMALWAVHVGAISVFLIKYPNCNSNPYPCETQTLSIISLVCGVMFLLLAYIIECVRASWLAKHGVNGGISGEKNAQDFRCLSYALFAVLLLNFITSIGPWCSVIYLINKTDGTSWILILACVQIVFFGLMAMWEVIVRKLKIFQVYEIESNIELRNNVGGSRSAPNAVVPIIYNDPDVENSIGSLGGSQTISDFVQ